MASAVVPVIRPVKSEFTDACAEVTLVHRAAGVLPLSLRRLSLRGQDRISFLHNVSSNDVKSLRPGQGCETLLLNPKGKIQIPFAVTVADDSADLWVEDSFSAGLKSAIESAVVMDDVTMQDRAAEYVVFHIAGPKNGDVLTALSLPAPAVPELSWLSQGETVVMRRRRTVESGVDIVCPAGQAETLFDRLCLAARDARGGPVGSIAQDILRIEAGIPAFGVDFMKDDFPQEASLEARAVSFTKGCYTGQEVVARIKTYGGVHHRLVGLVMDAPAPAPGETIYQGTDEAGQITSAARSLKLARTVALARVATALSSAGTVLRVSSPDGPVARVVDISAPVGGTPFAG